MEKIRTIFSALFGKVQGSLGSILASIRTSIISNEFLFIIVSIYIIAMSTFTILKNQAFLSSGFDLGISNQAFHNTIFAGKFFYETGDLSFNPGGSFFGVHFSPILVLMLPFYAIYPDAANLLVIQSAVLALGAFPIYWMARDKLGKDAALGISLIYLVYPPLLFVNLDDFHVQAFTSTFFLFSVYYLEKEDWRKFFAFMLLAMLTIEFAPIIGIFVGIYAFILHRQRKFKNLKASRKFIVLVVVMSILVLIIALKTKELFNNSTSPISSTFENIFQQPGELPTVIVSYFGDKVFYLMCFLMPVAFLPFLAPEPLVMALPWIGLSFMSSTVLYHSIFYQYNAFIIPFVMVALIKAVERLRLEKPKRIVPLLLLATIIILVYLPFVSGSPWNYRFPVSTEHTQMTHRILGLIPSDASVLTENDLFTHVSNRPNAYMYVPQDSPNIPIDYILIDVKSGWYKWLPEISGGKITPKGYVNETLNKRSYGILASADGVVLLKKGYEDKPVLYDPYVAEYDYNTLKISNGYVVNGDDTSRSDHVLFNGGYSQTYWYGPYVDLPPGLYKVTYFMKVLSDHPINPSDRLLNVDVSAKSGAISLEDRPVYGAQARLDGGWFGVSLFFGIKTPGEDMEFRGFAVGNANVYLDYIAVEQISPQPIADSVFDFRDLLVGCGKVSDGVIIHSKGNGTLWYGPYTYLPKGNYTAKFWLKLDNAYNGSLVDICVLTNAGKTAHGAATVSSFDFEAINKWQDFRIDFYLSKDSKDAEFPGMNVRSLAPVSFLLVEVYPIANG